MNKFEQKELELIKRSEGILRGLLRFNRVNEEDMPLIAEMIAEFLRTRQDFYGAKYSDKTMSLIIESMSYFHENKNG